MRTKPVALVIDDDPIFRKMLETVMGRLGIVTKTTDTIDEFQALSAILEPDLYVIDLHIGQDSGLTQIERLRGTLGSQTPIIVISGTSDQAMISHALEIGANEYVVKPFDMALLANKLHQFVKTNELDEHERYARTFDGNGAEARITFKGGLLSVDELGMRFSSRHLVSKGSVVKLAGGVLSEIDPEKTECMLCVTATTLDPATGTYEIYAEFEGADAVFLQSVRRWLTSKQAKVAA